MDTANILKEYLVSIGFSINDPSFKQFQRALKSSSDGVDDFAGKTITGFAKGATAFTAFLVTVNAGLAKYISGLGQADLQTQIFARRMWLSVDAARAYQSSMNVLGASLQDLYLSPELMQRYLTLRQQALGMQMDDKDYETAMRGVRDMTFEFQRLKLEGTYALQWIGYYLTKYIDPVLKDSGISLKSINDTIQRSMPQWTEKVAQIASWFVRLGAAVWDARGALAAIMAIFMAPKLISLATNPVFLMIAGLTTLLLLLDDYNTFTKHNGSKTLFDWTWLENIGKKLKASGLDFAEFKKDIGDIATDIGNIFSTLDKLAQTLGAKGGLAEILEKGIILTLRTLDDLLKSVDQDLKTLNNDLQGKPRTPLAPGATDIPIPGTNIKIHGNTGQDELDQWNRIKGFFSGIGNIFGHGISPMSYNSSGSGSGVGLMSYDSSSAPWSKKIYDVLYTYLPQLATALGIKINTGTNNQVNGLRLTDFADKVNQFISNAQSGATWVNYSPWQALYGNKTTNNNATQVSNSPTFNIYGAKDPNTTANVVNTSQNQLLTRAFKGVQV